MRKSEYMTATAILKRITFCLLFIATNVLAIPPEGEIRMHYLVASRDHSPLYYVTTITAGGETLASETYLFESTTGQRIIIDIRKNFKSHSVTADYSVSDAKRVRVTLQLPGSGATRSESLNEYRQRPELRDEDVEVTLERDGKILKTGEKGWRTGAESVREKAKSITGSYLAAAMKPLSAFLGFPPFGGACSTYQFVADGAKCSLSSSVLFATVRPDCDFDARFGRPCDSMQIGRAKQQPKNRTVGAY